MRRPERVLLVVFFVLAIFVRSASQERTGRLKIAEGEYTIFKEYGGVGPVDNEVFNFQEDWQLWRFDDGHYEVEGNRRFEAPKEFSHEFRFWVRLSARFELQEAKEYAPLMWAPHSEPLDCTFSPKALHCSAKGRHPDQNLTTSLSLSEPYALSWPLSAFSLAGLARQAEGSPGRSVAIQIVEIQQPSPSNPILPITTSGKIRYLGQEQVLVAGKVWQADKFELNAFMSSLPRDSLLWISSEGLLLKLEAHPQVGPKGSLELTRFEDRSGTPVSR